MRKGLIVTLLLVTFAWFSAQDSMAVSPIVGDPGDVVVGGIEPDDGGSTGTWVHVNVFDLRDLALDDDRVDKQETANGTFKLYKSNFKCKFIRVNFVSEVGGTAATIDALLLSGN